MITEIILIIVSFNSFVVVENVRTCHRVNLLKKQIKIRIGIINEDLEFLNLRLMVDVLTRVTHSK